MLSGCPEARAGTYAKTLLVARVGVDASWPERPADAAPPFLRAPISDAESRGQSAAVRAKLAS